MFPLLTPMITRKSFGLLMRDRFDRTVYTAWYLPREAWGDPSESCDWQVLRAENISRELIPIPVRKLQSAQKCSA